MVEPESIQVRAGPAADQPRRPLPGISDDTRFFWDGCREHRLLIQRCRQCATLRHPPGPVCGRCHSFDWDTVEAAGTGSLYSFVVMHYPEVPPFRYPNPVGLVQLDEGVRLVAGLVGVTAAELVIGMSLRVVFQEFQDGLILPMFEPA